MHCSNCAGEVSVDQRFCNACAAPLLRACARCGAENTSAARYCGQCTLRFDEPDTQVSPAAQAERRQLTVLFCDLVGSTALSEALDPEDLCEIVRQHQHACSRVIEAYDGHIAQYLGDGILVYFGYPRAHDDDVRRAVGAALEMIEATEQQKPPELDSLGVRLQLRVGIHTGLSVVGEVGNSRRRERLAIGETPNLAARVQEIAAPGTIAISHATYALARGFFECEDLGEHQLKGLSRRIHLHRVLRPSGAQTRIDVATTDGLTPYVGRDGELAELLDAWQEVVAGRPRAFLIEGEPGIGKSRQLAELRACIDHEAQTTLVCRCAPDSENSALRPLIESIERELGLAPELSPAQRRRRLAETFASIKASDGEAIELVASLLSVDSPGELTQLSAAHKRRRTLELLVRWIRDSAQRGPLLLAFEDLHWADPSTLEYIELLLESCKDDRLLIVLTHRPEFAPPASWLRHAWLSATVLPPLSAGDTIELMTHIAGATPLASDVALRIVARTDGIPLFVEELTRSVLEDEGLRERGRREQLAGKSPFDIPTSLQDLLTARLDRMGSCKATAQLAATIGREFDYALLAAARGLDSATLHSELAQLVAANLIRPRGPDLQGSYEFRHVLFQDAAYQSLVRHTRRDYHAMVAGALVERFPSLIEQRPELIARHFAGARMHEQAVDYFQRASMKALERSANREAIAHARAGLVEVPLLPSEHDRELSELSLLTLLGPALIANTGFASDEVGAAYARARTLCDRLDGRAEVFPSLWGSWVFRLVRGELSLARAEAESMLRLGEQTEDDGVLVEAHWTLGDALYWMGDLETADRHLRAAAGLYDPERHRTHAFRFGQDPGVATHCYHAATLWTRGQTREALASLQRATALADQLNHPFTTAWLNVFRFLVYMFMRDPHTALGAAEQTVEFCTREAHPFWLSTAIVVSNWARARLGDPEAGLAGMREGIAFYESMGSRLCQPLMYSLVAEVALEHGQYAQASDAIERGFAHAEQNGEELGKIELLRLLGELLAERGDIERARAVLEDAQRLADRLGAHGYGLRVAVALHRVSPPIDTVENSPLARMVARFDDQPESTDLHQARLLLRGELGQPPPSAADVAE